MGVVHKPDPGWASFIPALVKCLELTDGPVLELGAGIFSTPLLHVLCRNRFLLTLESDPHFIDMLKKFRTPNHSIDLVRWDENLGIVTQPDHDSPWSVVLIDQKPAEARKETVKLVTDADYVVIHDSNDPAYDYESIYPLFKHRFTHEYLQHTTVLSNKHELNIFRSTLN